jgi:hypothetical protein
MQYSKSRSEKMSDHLAGIDHRHCTNAVLGQARGGLAHRFARRAMDDSLVSSGDQSGNRHRDSPFVGQPICHELAGLTKSAPER